MANSALTYRNILFCHPHALLSEGCRKYPCHYNLICRLLNQHSPVPRARSSIDEKDATRAQIYAGLGDLLIVLKPMYQVLDYRKYTRKDLVRVRFILV